MGLFVNASVQPDRLGGEVRRGGGDGWGRRDEDLNVGTKRFHEAASLLPRPDIVLIVTFARFTSVL